MKVGVFSPYLETRGGGERYLLTVAQYFVKRGDSVDLFWDQADKKLLADTFHLDLSSVNFVPDVFFSDKSLWEKLLVTAKYDLIFFLSDGSIPSSLARKNILHFQRPFRLTNQKTLLNRLKLSRFSAIVCNSEFTKRDVDKTFGIKSLVLYPPVDTKSFQPKRKTNLILSVGRFFAPSNPKKQEVLVDAFIGMVKSGFRDYRLVLVGGVTGDSSAAVAKLQAKSKNFPIEIISDASFPKLQDLYSQARFFWHAAGFGEDLEKAPDKAEHFGITTVEAMSAGVVPIVFAGGGQKEIITSGKNGFFWQTPVQLAKITSRLAADAILQKKVAAATVARSKAFSIEKFFAKLDEIV